MAQLLGDCPSWFPEAQRPGGWLCPPLDGGQGGAGVGEKGGGCKCKVRCGVQSPGLPPRATVHLRWVGGARPDMVADTRQGESWLCVSWALSPRLPTDPDTEENLERTPYKSSSF